MGGFRKCVACSKSKASLINSGSAHARPRNSIPTGDPQPGLATIKTKVYALNFADDEFNPAELHVLEELMPRVREGRFIVQLGSAESFGHLTMAQPELWSGHVTEFMRSLGDEALQSPIENRKH
jgi:hypothetical protein